jgi:hypothetical protein
MPFYSRRLKNPQFYSYLPMKMEQTQRSETSAHKIHTPGNYPEESIQHPLTSFTAERTHILCNRWIRMNVFKIVLWAVTFILVHMYHWLGLWHPAVWCMCTSELGEAAASIVWVSAVIRASNHACRFFGCLTFWHMMQKRNSLLYVF